MTPRVSAAALPSSTRVSVDDLTPMEQDAAAAAGQIGPMGFVDIEKPEAPAMVDLKADARKKAVAALTSVAGPPVAAPTTPVAEGATDEYVKEISDLQEKLKSRSPCPRCGLGINDTCETTATPADIEEFLKCVLSATPFSKSYLLFGGKLKVTMVTRDGRTDDAIRRVVTEKLRQRELVSETEIFAMMRQLTMAVSLRSYITGETTLDYPPLEVKSLEDFTTKALERVDSIPSHIQGFLRPVMAEFNTLVDLLTARAQDQSFWQGTPA